jgi:hypothetical protein
MTEQEQQEQQAIERHLSEDFDIHGRRVFHAFGAALKDARRVTGRDVATGQLLCTKHAGSWIGAIGYLALLDQLGACFKPKGTNPIDKNDIYKALHYFTKPKLKEAEIWAIYALRCAFAHDYSLYNRNGEHPERQHRFAVSQGRTTLVELPTTQWNGEYDNQDVQCLTKIDLQQLGDLVEDVVRRVRILAEQHKLEIVLGGREAELSSRYTLIAGPVTATSPH